jgi:hypothetical protein
MCMDVDAHACGVSIGVECVGFVRPVVSSKEKGSLLLCKLARNTDLKSLI